MFHRLCPLSFLLLFSLVGACSQNGRQAGLLAGNKNSRTTVITVLLLDNTTISSAKALDTAFAKAAPRYGLILLREKQTVKVDFYLKGYFSVLTDESPFDNAILYVFDILDQSGLRLHRVEGRYPLRLPLVKTPERFWESIPPEGYNTIADNILNQINKWQLQSDTKKSIL